jgi:predicted DCC family thiol-disulfide oxidoreductase YuxK
MGSSSPIKEGIVLFDGVCNLCNAAVQFIIKRDPGGRIKFASLQSDAGQSLLEANDLSTNQFHSIIFLKGDVIYQESDAVLQIARELNSPLAWLSSAAAVIPRPVRNWIYRWVSRNRYKVFGKREECMVPTPDLRKRFL